MARSSDFGYVPADLLMSIPARGPSHYPVLWVPVIFVFASKTAWLALMAEVKTAMPKTTYFIQKHSYAINVMNNTTTVDYKLHLQVERAKFWILRVRKTTTRLI